MRLTRRRRRKIYKGIGLGALIVLIIWLIIINPFKYIHIEIKPKEESSVIKNDEIKEAEKEKEKQAAEAAKKLEEQKKKAEEEAAKKKAEEEKKKLEEEKKKQQEQEAKKDVYYTATFFNKDGSVIKMITLKVGSIPYYNGDTPEYYDGIYYYQFIGWDRSFTAITGNTTFIAQYEIVGSVPKPKPKPDPTPDPTPDPPEPVLDYVEEDLTDYDNLFRITNIGEKKGRIQIIKGVGDYSKFEAPFNTIVNKEVKLQYSTDRVKWYEFHAYGEYDICAVILNTKTYNAGKSGDKYIEKNVGQELGVELPSSITNSKEPLIIEPHETIYFRVPTGSDNPGFSSMVYLASKKYDLDTIIPCVNTFDIQGLDKPDSTTFEVAGELMSIIDDGYVNNGKDNKKKATLDILGFAGLFANISDDLFYEITGNRISRALKLEAFDCHTGDNIVKATNLVLPSKEDIDSVPELCYAYMFSDSNNLINPPNVDVGILGEECYLGLFSSCNRLEEYPYTLETELARGCYSEMFSNCISLTTVGEDMLPQENLVDRCYSRMFIGTSLEVLPELPADILAEGCYSSMYENCSSLDEIENMSNYLNATHLAPKCYYGMFKNSSIDELPYLYATTLADYCYSNMFSGCYNLTSVDTNYLLSKELAPLCYDSMFAGSSITNAPKLPANFIYEGSYNCMFYDCTSLVDGPIIDANEFSTDMNVPPFDSMFFGCSKLKQVSLTNSEWTLDNVLFLSGMFNGTESKILDGEREATRTLSLYCNLEDVDGLRDSFYSYSGLNPEYWEIRYMIPQRFQRLPFFFSFFKK